MNIQTYHMSLLFVMRKIIEELISAYHVVKKLPFSTAVLRSLQTIQTSPPRQSRSGLDLMQVSGFTVVADKLNQVCCAVVSFFLGGNASFRQETTDGNNT